MSTQEQKQVYGVLAQFDTPELLIAAAEKVRDEGYRTTDAFSSFPLHGIHDALGARPSRLSAAVLLGGILGAAAGLLLQKWVSVDAYPHIIAGKPLFSWPSYVPIIFECTILGASLTAFVGMLARNGLPRPHHPVFDGTWFDEASTDGFFLCIEASDRLFKEDETAAFVASLNPNRYETVYTAETD